MEYLIETQKSRRLFLPSSYPIKIEASSNFLPFSRSFVGDCCLAIPRYRFRLKWSKIKIPERVKGDGKSPPVSVIITITNVSKQARPSMKYLRMRNTTKPESIKSSCRRFWSIDNQSGWFPSSSSIKIVFFHIEADCRRKQRCCKRSLRTKKLTSNKRNLFASLPYSPPNPQQMHLTSRSLRILWLHSGEIFNE